MRVENWHIAVGGAGIAVVGWIGYRLRQRSELANLLTQSTAVAQGHALGVISWTPQSKAAEMLPFTSTLGVDQAFAVVQQELRLLMPAISESPSLVEDAARVLSEKTGVDVQGTAASIYAQLPDIPGVDLSSWFSKGS